MLLHSMSRLLDEENTELPYTAIETEMVAKTKPIMSPELKRNRSSQLIGCDSVNLGCNVRDDWSTFLTRSHFISMLNKTLNDTDKLPVLTSPEKNNSRVIPTEEPQRPFPNNIPVNLNLSSRKDDSFLDDSSSQKGSLQFQDPATHWLQYYFKILLQPSTHPSTPLTLPSNSLISSINPTETVAQISQTMQHYSGHGMSTPMRHTETGKPRSPDAAYLLSCDKQSVRLCHPIPLTDLEKFNDSERYYGNYSDIKNKLCLESPLSALDYRMYPIEQINSRHTSTPTLPTSQTRSVVDHNPLNVRGFSQLQQENNRTSPTRSARLKCLIQQIEKRLLDDTELAEICDFARYFKLRRITLGFTQTQVGSALNAREGPAYSQSAICRFEKLDVTAKSARRMKPILEQWLHETEALHGDHSKVVDLQSITPQPPRKRKRRTCFSPQALVSLLDQLKRNPYPSRSDMINLSERLTYDREVIRVWFCNRRQTLKSEGRSVGSTASESSFDMKTNHHNNVSDNDPLNDPLQEPS